MVARATLRLEKRHKKNVNHHLDIIKKLLGRFVARLLGLFMG
jgi:hypothetical protein